MISATLQLCVHTGCRAAMATRVLRSPHWLSAAMEKKAQAATTRSTLTIARQRNTTTTQTAGPATTPWPLATATETCGRGAGDGLRDRSGCAGAARALPQLWRGAAPRAMGCGNVTGWLSAALTGSGCGPRARVYTVARARGAADGPWASPRLSAAACASITRYNRFPRNLANLANRRIC